MMPRYRLLLLGMFVLFTVGLLATPVASVMAEDAKPAAEKKEKEKTLPEKVADVETVSSTNSGNMDAMWTLIAGVLVFFMQAGFAMVECGFTRAKNACNIVMKNLMDFAFGSLVFWAVGFGLMFGISEGYFGTTGFLFDGQQQAAALGKSESFSWAFLLFQTVFCATAATIVSGAMAERTKFVSYIIYSCAITAIVYPIFGAWAWGGLWAGKGWLEKLSVPFHDFAGSTVVHSIGGWCALAGAIVLGARIGKYKDGKTMPIPGHNIPIAALGVFILWLGWFGFNPGSTTAVGADGASFAFIAITTNLAAAAGAVMAMVTSWLKFKKPDPSFTLNGALAGLVAITAGCDVMTPKLAVVTGGVAGVLVVFAVLMFDKLKIDDPVGAVSVHGVCGAWGTIAVGLFPALGFKLYAGAEASLTTQLTGVGMAFLWAFPVSFAIFYALKMTIGLRVSEQEEMEGLDIHEHGMLAYPPGFVSELQTGSPTHGAPVSAYTKAPKPSAKPVPAGQS
jgi:ammonium transporter, Amt family